MAGGFDRFDTILVTVSRDEVVTGDVSGALSALSRFIEEPEIARQMFERVMAHFMDMTKTHGNCLKSQTCATLFINSTTIFLFGFSS